MTSYYLIKGDTLYHLKIKFLEMSSVNIQLLAVCAIFIRYNQIH